MAHLLWLRDELFDHGVVHTFYRHTKRVSRANVDAVLTSLRAVDSTSVKYDTFVEAARTHWQWSVEEAELCVQLFFMFSPEHRVEELSTAELPFLEFALFIFVQLYVPVVASSPVRHLAHTLWPSSENMAGAGSPTHHSSGGSGPGGVAASHSPHGHPNLHLQAGGGKTAPPASPSSPTPGGHLTSPQHKAAPVGRGQPISPSSPRGLALNTRATEQAHRLQFVKKHVVDILRILYYASDPDAASHLNLAESSAGIPILSRRALASLSFLIACGSSVATRARSVAEVSPWFAGEGKDNETARVSPGVLVEWLSSHLTVNEVLHPAVAQLPVPVAAQATPAATVVPLIGCPSRIACSREYEPVKARSLGAVKESEVPVVRPLLVSGIQKATAVLAPETKDGALPALRMDHCWDSYVYVTTAVSFATIVGCSHCTIVVGAVQGGVLVEHCENLRVIVAGRVVRVSNSVDCSLFLHTPSRPLISGDCRGLQFAPHNAPYRSLREHMKRCGLSEHAENQWNRPIVLAKLQHRAVMGESKGDEADSHHFFKLQPTANFAVITVPTVTLADEPSAAEPLALPAAHSEALATRAAAVKKLRRSIKEEGLTEAQSFELQAAVQAHFREWLVTSGSIRQVTDLVRLHRDETKDRRSSSGMSSKSSVSSSDTRSPAHPASIARRRLQAGESPPLTPPPASRS